MTKRRALERVSRRAFVGGATAALTAAPWIVRAQGAPTLKFRTIPDPDGWAESLRLKGDWLIFEISDGVLSGFGEASHSNDDAKCKQTAVQLFEQHYRGFTPSLDGIAIASGFVPVRGSPPDGGGSLRGDVAVRTARYPAAAIRRAQYPSAPVGKHPEATTSFAPTTPSRITSSQIAASVR